MNKRGDVGFKTFLNNIFLKIKTILIDLKERSKTSLNQIRKIPAPENKKSSVDRSTANTSSNISRKLLFIIIGIILIICIVAAMAYYFYFYLKPNFEDIRFNYISSATQEEVMPGDEITYDIYYMNTGFRNVDDLKIILIFRIQQVSQLHPQIIFLKKMVPQ